VEREEFDLTVEQCWNELPDEWKKELEEANISYEIIDLATNEIAAKAGTSPWNLLGLFSGVPKTIRHKGFEPMAFPDRITVFRLPIMSRVFDIESLRKTIKHVLYHEIGHYFGLSEDELRQAQGDPL
jgi:predicted Zn-dependent protease with MMP-like domain